jgi:Kef-type K+ transport system membrane component KefB
MVILKTVLFFVASAALGILLYKFFSWCNKRWPHRRRIVIFSIAFCFALSYVAEAVFGIAEITGAFVAGIILCNIDDSEYVDRRVSISSYLFFGPIFFASIGLKTDLSSMTWALFAFSAAFVAAAILGKIVGCGFIYKVTGHSLREALIVGIGMMTRGEVALIVTQKGLDAGLIAPEYFAPVIILIIFTSVLTPILLKVLFGKEKKVAATEG